MAFFSKPYNLLPVRQYKWLNNIFKPVSITYKKLKSLKEKKKIRRKNNCNNKKHTNPKQNKKTPLFLPGDSTKVTPSLQNWSITRHRAATVKSVWTRTQNCFLCLSCVSVSKTYIIFILWRRIVSCWSAHSAFKSICKFVSSIRK